MRVFLIDKGKEYSYDELLSLLNAEQIYCPLFRGTDLFAYFCNLIRALACGKSLILLDSDLSSSEIDGIDEDEINKSIALDRCHFNSISDVVDAIEASSSEITIFTSGTTGQPKKVIHTIASLTRSVRKGEKYQNQVWGYAYNPTHMAGLQVFFQAFENLNTLVNVFNAGRLDVYAAIEENQITHLSATPTFYRLLLPFGRAYTSVQRATLGGEKSDRHLYDAIGRIFPNAKINNVYASTEAGSLFAAKGDCFQIPSAIKDKFEVKDKELMIHKSLLGQSDSFEFDGDYYHSGDIIEWVDEANGIFRFSSRKNELINVGGYKVNPGETENAILSINGVRQALVFGKPNAILGNVLCAEVLLEEGAELKEVDIRKILKEHLQDFKIPRKIKFVESFSLTRTGKLKRS